MGQFMQTLGTCGERPREVHDRLQWLFGELAVGDPQDPIAVRKVILIPRAVALEGLS